ARLERVPASRPPGADLRLDPPNHDEARRDERVPPRPVQRHVPPSAHPDLRAARPLHRLPVRQDLNLACLTHAYPRWEGDVAGAFVERLVLALKARGHGVHVVAPADAGKGGKELRHQVPVTRVRYAPARWETLAYRGSMVAAARSPVGFLAATSLVCRQARVVGRLCREEQLELVHAHWWIPGGVSAWLARRPYVVTVHGTDVALLERSPPARMLARRVLRGAAAVTAVSSYLAGRAAHVAGLDQARILVQPMPLDTRAFTRSSRGGGGGGGGGGGVTGGRPSPQTRLPFVRERRGLRGGGGGEAAGSSRWAGSRPRSGSPCCARRWPSSGRRAAGCHSRSWVTAPSDRRWSAAPRSLESRTRSAFSARFPRRASPTCSATPTCSPFRRSARGSVSPRP